MLEYRELIDGIRKSYPNYYPRHYDQNVKENKRQERVQIAEGLSQELYEHFVDMQPDGYTADTKPRPVFMPRSEIYQSIELMTDYMLANDHARGLMIKREADGMLRNDEIYPILGEGARRYQQRELILTDDEKRRVKVCEVCQSNFVDDSRRKNAKVCGVICRKQKDTLRNRVAYNEKIKGLADEKRLKRDHERQDFEYPFYSPYEISSLSNRSERAYGDDKVERTLYNRDEEYDSTRLNGRRKPKYVGRDEFDDKQPFNYRPKGRNPVETDKDFKAKSGAVIVRNLSEISKDELDAEKFLEADEMRGISRVKPYARRVSEGFTLEKHAI